jgi:hypothetical protein
LVSLIPLNHSVVKLYKYMFSVMICSHWMACLWYLVATLNREECSWVTKCDARMNAHCERCDAITRRRVVFACSHNATPPLCRYFTGSCDALPDGVTNVDVYVAAFYWAVVRTHTRHDAMP